jgi:hypothetical protein
LGTIFSPDSLPLFELFCRKRRQAAEVRTIVEFTTITIQTFGVPALAAGGEDRDRNWRISARLCFIPWFFIFIASRFYKVCPFVFDRYYERKGSAIVEPRLVPDISQGVRHQSAKGCRRVVRLGGSRREDWHGSRKAVRQPNCCRMVPRDLCRSS